MIKLYTFVLLFGTQRYCGQVPATSFEEAQKFVPNGVEWGELVEIQESALCVICRGTISQDMTKPEPIADTEWADVLEG